MARALLKVIQLVLTLSSASSTPIDLRPPKTGLLGAMTAVYRTCIGTSGATGSVLQVVSLLHRTVIAWSEVSEAADKSNLALLMKDP